jgi:hypothetical protein
MTMTLDQYRARLEVKKFLEDPHIENIKTDLQHDDIPWLSLQRYAAETKSFEKAPPEERE